MNLLRIIKITFITALISFTATSCLNDDRTPNIPTYATMVLSASSPGVTVPNESPYYFVAEDSTVLFPINFGVIKSSEIKNNQRYLILYTKYENEEGNTKSAKEPLLIEITSYDEILTKEILVTSKIDTVGNNITKLLGTWYSGRVHGAKSFININFRFYLGSNPQYFDLVEDNSEDTSPIIDGYYQLEFRISGKSNLHTGRRAEGLISFLLAEKYLHDDIKGLRISFKEDETGDITIKDYPYLTK